MRSSVTQRSAATKRTVTAGPKGGAGAGSATVDERDDYIVNLKGQIYLLSIENEMMKKSISAPSRQALSPLQSAGASSRVAQTNGSLMSSQMPQAEYPTEIGDAFEMMRQKYGQLEHKYQHDLEEARRGAEALASQCAAQSSLISTLKREIAGSSQVLADQKTIVQRVEAKSAADLERAQRDIAHLHARIVELGDEKVKAADAAAAALVVLADAKSRASMSAVNAEVTEAARKNALDSYARQLLASRFLLKKWRAELWARRAAQDSFDQMRVDKALAEKRALRAEAESAKCLAMAETASVKQVEQLEAAASEREELIKKIDALSFALSQSESGRASAEHTMRILSEQIPALSTRFETSAGALAKTEAQVSLLVARGAELERLLTSKAAEAEALRSAAIAAEERQASALISLRGCEDSLANAHARCQALETTEREQTRMTEVLKRELETAGQARAISEAELTSLRDELSRRPPIDVIKELDVENLLQRNMQAAAAMGQLLAWQSSHVPKPVAGLDINH